MKIIALTEESYVVTTDYQRLAMDGEQKQTVQYAIAKKKPPDNKSGSYVFRLLGYPDRRFNGMPEHRWMY